MRIVPAITKDQHWYSIGVIIAVTLGGLLIFANLGNRVLWEDEAQTAILARQILKCGLPMFNETHNIPTDRADHSDFNSDGIFIWNTWLPYYLTATSFFFFGETEWSARLPFAIFGLLTILLYSHVAKELFKSNPRLVFIAVLMLISCVPFLLHMRQSRYYALITFGTLWMIWGYLSLLRGSKWGCIHITVSGLFCFHSFYAVAGINMATIWLHALWRERHSNVLRCLTIATAVIIGAALPFVVYMRLWRHPVEENITIFWIGRSLWIYLLWLNGFLLPFILPVVVAIVGRIKGRFILMSAYIIFLLSAPISASHIQLVSLIVMFLLLLYFNIRFKWWDSSTLEGKFYDLLIILLLLYILVMSAESPYPFYRYIVPLLPVVLLAGASMIGDLSSRNKVAGGLFLTALLTYNSALGALPLNIWEFLTPQDGQKRYSVSPREIEYWTDLRSDLGDYLYEITHDTPDPEKGVIDYLKQHGTDNQIVKISYDDLPLMFYLPHMRIISRWDAEGGIPDYLIIRDPYPLAQSNNFLNMVQGIEYKAEEIPFPNLVWANNPDPLFHLYKIPRHTSNITVFRKIQKEKIGGL